jgi:hypothetical protein
MESLHCWLVYPVIQVKKKKGGGGEKEYTLHL